MLTTPLYSALAEDREMAAYFLLDQQMGPEPRLSEYPDVDLSTMLLPAQSESVNPIRSNAESAA